MHEIRFGIIGARMGLVHGEALRLIGGGRVSALCDRREDMLENGRQKLGLEPEACTTDYRALLAQEDVDAVIVASPDQFHEEHTVAALDAGRHVLCEKPMACSVEECSRMVRASERASRKLMVGQIARYAPGFVAAKKLIEAGEIGDLFLVESEYAHDYTFHPGVDNWRQDPVRIREPVLGGGCHAVDLLRWIGGNPIDVCAFANRKVLTDWPVDDCSVGIMRFPGGVLGRVMVSIGCKRDYTMRSVFYGTQGTVIADNTSPHLTVFKQRISEKDAMFSGTPDQVVPIMYPVGVNNHNAAGEIAEFMEIVRNDLPVKTNGREGAATVAVCLAMVESAARDGQRVVVGYDL
jgi:UDP-N-acetylglucosamine 3-dehydrogenase